MNSQSQAWEIDLLSIGRAVRARRALFISTMGAVFIFTVVILHVVPKSYDVSMGLVPVTQSNQQIGGSLGALARLGGVNIGDTSGAAGQFRLFVSSVNSRDVADELAKNNSLMQELFPEQWSERDRRWKEPSSILHTVHKIVQAILGIPLRPWAPPSGEDVAQLLSTRLEVDDDPKSPVVMLRMQVSRPQVGVDLMRNLVQTIDTQLRARALHRADDYIAYLSKEVNSVTVAEYRAALVDHLSEQEQIRMMASAKVSFAAQIFSGPTALTQPSAPKSVLLLLFSLIAGAALAGALAVLAERLRWKMFTRLQVASVKRMVGAWK